MSQCTTLYILKDRNAPHIKIGVAGADVLSRAAALPEAIDHEQSVFVECGKSASRLEKTLHMMFEEHRVAKPPADGYTEWFADLIRDELLAFLVANAQRFRISEPRPLPPKPAPPASKAAPDVLVAAEPAGIVYLADALEQLQRLFADHCAGKIKNKPEHDSDYPFAFVFRDESVFTKRYGREWDERGRERQGYEWVSLNCDHFGIFFSGSQSVYCKGTLVAWFTLNREPSPEETEACIQRTWTRHRVPKSGEAQARRINHLHGWEASFRQSEQQRANIRQSVQAILDGVRELSPAEAVDIPSKPNFFGRVEAR